MSSECSPSSILTKRCSRCEEVKEVGCFYADKSRHDGLSRPCKACDNKARAGRINRTPESQRRHRENKRRTAIKRWGSAGKMNKMRGYGITPEEYAQMLEGQGGRCAICRTDQFWPESVQGYQPCIDHCHEGDFIRGLLCMWCNTMLGYAKDRPEVLRDAARYLERFAREAPAA